MKNIKVVVDYTNGAYNIEGVLNGKPFFIRKPIKGVDKGGIFNANYSRKFIKNRKNQIRERLEELAKMNPDFKYSRKLVDKVDTLMYKALEDWDEMAGTSYADDYIKTITQSLELSDKEAKMKKSDDLANSGIDISYNVGLFNTSKNLNLIDRIKGIIIAKKQEEIFGAKVQNSFTLKPDYYLDDIINFEDDFIRKKQIEEAKRKINMPPKKKISIKKAPRTPSTVNYEEKIESDNKTDVEELIKEVFKKVRSKKIQNESEPIEDDYDYFVASDVSKPYIYFGNEHSKKIMSNMEEGHWTRIIEDDEDLIQNKRYNPNIGLKVKKIIGAVSLLAAGIVALSLRYEGSSKISKIEKGSIEETSVQRVVQDSEQNKDTIIDDIISNNLESKKVEQNGKSKLKNEKIEQNEKTETKKEIKIDVETEAHKIEEFKKTADKYYKDTIVIGEKPNIGDLLVSQTFSENPDGTGNKGYFANYPDYIIEFVNIATNDGFVKINTEGRNLSSILVEYPDYITYSFHVKDAKTGNSLGFVTEVQYEKLIKKQINSIIKLKTTEKKQNSDLENDER